MRKVHVDFNRQDGEHRLLVSSSPEGLPLTVGEQVELYQMGEPDMNYKGVVDEVNGIQAKIRVNW